MSDDEAAIRAVVAQWMEATQAGDAERVLALMTEDAVFTVADSEPFGKATFAEMARAGAGPEIEGTNEIVEIQVLGDWAFTRNHIRMTVTPPGGTPIARSGYTLTLFRKGDDGRWRLARDANLVTPD